MFDRSCGLHSEGVPLIFNSGVQVGFKMFLNTSAAVANWNADSTECSLVGSRCYSIVQSLFHESELQ